MINCLVKDKKLSIVCSGTVVDLTIVPMTFMKLIDINTALPEGKDLSSVMEAPTPLDLSVVTYCLLDDESRKKIDNMGLEISGNSEETTAAHKLFYLMCENNLADGMQNYNKVLTVVVDQVKDSTSQEETKKKVLVNPLSYLRKKFTTRSVQTIPIPISNS